MIHAHEKYNRIQDPEWLIGLDEPVFLVRARDPMMPLVMTVWIINADRVGIPLDVIDTVRHHLEAVVLWQLHNGTKVPGTSE